MAGSSRQVYANCIHTGIKQHIEVLPRIESTSAGSRAVSPRDRKCINLRKQDKPCLPNSEAKGGKARVAINFVLLQARSGCSVGYCVLAVRELV